MNIDVLTYAGAVHTIIFTMACVRAGVCGQNQHGDLFLGGMNEPPARHNPTHSLSMWKYAECQQLGHKRGERSVLRKRCCGLKLPASAKKIKSTCVQERREHKHTRRVTISLSMDHPLLFILANFTADASTERKWWLV